MQKTHLQIDEDVRKKEKKPYGLTTFKKLHLQNATSVFRLRKYVVAQLDFSIERFLVLNA